jgi:hypothetical protein
MTKLEFINKYLYGLDGQEVVPYDKFLKLLEDLSERGCGAKVTLVADTVGKAEIEPGDGFVVITPKTNANDIVHLPAVADIEIGHQVRGVCTATGCEIRVAVDDDAVVYLNNNNTTVNEAALAAGASFLAILVAADRWILLNFAAAGTVTSPTPD